MLQESAFFCAFGLVQNAYKLLPKNQPPFRKTLLSTRKGKALKPEALEPEPTHSLHSSSFLGLPYRILNTNHRKELLWSLWQPMGKL